MTVATKPLVATAVFVVSSVVHMVVIDYANIEVIIFLVLFSMRLIQNIPHAEYAILLAQLELPSFYLPRHLPSCKASLVDA